MAYAPTYQQYWDANISAADDGGNTNAQYLLSEEDYNKYSDGEKQALFLSSAQGPLGGDGFYDYELGADDEFGAQFRAKFGDTPEGIANNKFEMSNQARGGLRIGYDVHGAGGPGYGRADWNTLALDPSRILWLDPEGTPNRRYVYEGNNRRGDVVVAEQARADDAGLGDNFWIVGVLAVAAPYLIEAIPSLMAAPEAAATVTAAEGAVGAGVVGDAELALAAETFAGGGVTGTGATTAGVAGTAATTAIPEIATAPGLVEAPITAANALTPAVTVNGVSGNMLTQGWQWYQNLSPAARQLLGGALSTGVSAGLATSRQNDMIDARNQERDTARSDTIRRGSVPLQTTTYTQRPLPGGLVASTMGQGGKT